MKRDPEADIQRYSATPKSGRLFTSRASLGIGWPAGDYAGYRGIGVLPPWHTLLSSLKGELKPMLELTGVTHVYANSTRALDDVSLSIPAGMF